MPDQDSTRPSQVTNWRLAGERTLDGIEYRLLTERTWAEGVGHFAPFIAEAADDISALLAVARAAVIACQTPKPNRFPRLGPLWAALEPLLAEVTDDD